MDIFQTCHEINDQLIANNETEARNILIRLLDFHERESIQYSTLVNHLIRETGLYPYLDVDNSDWQEKYVYELFKTDVGQGKNITLHREQSALLKKLLDGDNLAVSAPTSFGKSFIIDAFISIKRPKNVVIIVPTIALTDETRRRLYKKFANEYKIITTADIQLAEKNIFIFPQERAINYVGKIEDLDILIVDEFYKASMSFDRDRSPMLLKAILKLGNIAKQKYFLAPNITELEENPFTKDMEFYPLDFNTVFLEQKNFYEEIKGNEQLKSDMLLDIISENKKTLIYAGTYANIDRISNLFLENVKNKESELLNKFSEWLAINYDYNWSLTKLIRKGTGIHNGKLHRSLSQIQVKLFEEDNGIDNLISTSSIIEGVNTSAENIVIWSNKNGRANINDFTYKNIMGRGGRMFKHFIGKIFILDKPPKSVHTQLDLPFPDQILGDLDESQYESQLTKEQVAKIILYKEEMSDILGSDIFNNLQKENIFQSSDSEIVKKIAIDMIQNPNDWNGLGFLNSTNTNNWERFLYKIVNIVPGGWDAKHGTLVEFVKILKNNWFKTIPELLQQLDTFDIALDDFFALERKVTFKLASLVNDINILQREILKEKNYNISRFQIWCSNAFLPPLVYQLEEFGLPRMISKKIQNEKLYNFYLNEIEIHDVLADFNSIGKDKFLQLSSLHEFDKYIINYFFDGISIKKEY